MLLVTSPSRPHLALVPPPADDPFVEEEADQTPAVAAEVACVLANAADDVQASAPLVIPLALSVCMERHGVGIDDLLEAMRLVRAAVLSVSGLDSASEPVPLVPSDSRSAVLRLAGYLHELFGRAARAGATPREVIASSVAAQLRAS